MSRHEDRRPSQYFPKGHPKRSFNPATADHKTVSDLAELKSKLLDLAAHFAKPDPNVRAYYPQKEFSNCTVRVFLTLDGKGKRGDFRYVKPTVCPRTGRDKYDGKGVFVASAHLKGVNGAQYGENGTFEMPLSVAVGLGFIRGKEASTW